jgi:diacylglycerol kinase family enzyme
MERFFAIVNPAAGGGRSAKLAGPALARLREGGVHVDVIASTGPGHAVQLAREAFDQGYRRFIAVGGDGTAHEILNGVFSAGAAQRRIALGFCRWAPAIPSSATSATTAPKSPFKPSSRAASAPSISSA